MEKLIKVANEKSLPLRNYNFSNIDLSSLALCRWRRHKWHLFRGFRRAFSDSKWNWTSILSNWNSFFWTISVCSEELPWCLHLCSRLLWLDSTKFKAMSLKQKSTNRNRIKYNRWRSVNKICKMLMWTLKLYSNK